jgi:hypothetical protein
MLQETKAVLVRKEETPPYSTQISAEKRYQRSLGECVLKFGKLSSEEEAPGSEEQPPQPT